MRSDLEPLQQEVRERLLTMIIPRLCLLLVLSDETQELHQRPLLLDVEQIVLEDILTPVRNFEKLLGGRVVVRSCAHFVVREHPPATDSQKLELTVDSR